MPRLAWAQFPNLLVGDGKQWLGLFFAWRRDRFLPARIHKDFFLAKDADLRTVIAFESLCAVTRPPAVAPQTAPSRREQAEAPRRAALRTRPVAAVVARIAGVRRIADPLAPVDFATTGSARKQVLCVLAGCVPWAATTADAAHVAGSQNGIPTVLVTGRLVSAIHCLAAAQDKQYGS